MTVTTDVVNQGIVLASILAGFAFSITAQVIMGEDKSKNAQRLSFQLLEVGLFGLVAVVIGIGYLASVDDAADQRAMGNAFLFSLGAAIFLFGWTMVGMVNSYQTDRALKWISIAAIIAILFFIGLVVVVIINLATPPLKVNQRPSSAALGVIQGGPSLCGAFPGSLGAWSSRLDSFPVPRRFAAWWPGSAYETRSNVPASAAGDEGRG